MGRWASNGLGAQCSAAYVVFVVERGPSLGSVAAPDVALAVNRGAMALWWLLRLCLRLCVGYLDALMLDPEPTQVHLRTCLHCHHRRHHRRHRHHRWQWGFCWHGR